MASPFLQYTHTQSVCCLLREKCQFVTLIRNWNNVTLYPVQPCKLNTCQQLNERFVIIRFEIKSGKVKYWIKWRWNWSHWPIVDCKMNFNEKNLQKAFSFSTDVEHFIEIDNADWIEVTIESVYPFTCCWNVKSDVRALKLRWFSMRHSVSRKSHSLLVNWNPVLFTTSLWC